MIFYRANCADMALCEADIDADFIASARAVLVTGTHFSKPNTEAAQMKAMRIASEHGGKVMFDIDYRPNLWGLLGHAAGVERYVGLGGRLGEICAGPAVLRPRRRHRGGNPDRLRRERSAGGAAGDPRGDARDHRAEARGDGLHHL